TYTERSRVDLRWHAAVASHVVQKVPTAVHERATPGLPCLAQRSRIAEQCIRRRGRLDDLRQCESRSCGALWVQTKLLDRVEDGRSPRQVGLGDTPPDRVLPRWIGETPVTLVGLYRRNAGCNPSLLTRHPQQLGEQHRRMRAERARPPSRGGG